MAQFNIPYQNLSANIPDEGVPFRGTPGMGDKQVFIRQGKQLFTIPKEQFQGNFDALPVDNPRSEGLQWLMGGDAPIQRIDWSQFSAIPRANGEETITQTVSAVNPHGVDVVSNLDGQITKSPSIQENLARAGGTPEQIASLSASATQNAGGAYTPEQLKTAGVIPPTSVIPPNRDDILGSASQTLSDIQKRISTEGITDASGKVLLAPTPPKPPAPIGSVATSPSGTVNPPVLPQPQAEGINDTFITSMLADLDAKRKAVEASYSKQLADLKTQSEASQKKIDDLTIKQEGAIDKAQELSQPFRESLEELKRKELYITQNFEDNQKLTNELSTLLTEGNDLIRQQKEKTGLEAIRNPRINQTISDVNARAGVIQAVMNARSGQIAEAYRMIDRTVSAITADKKDQLNYYSTLYDFYKDKKDDEGKKLAVLSSDKNKFLEAQIKLLENDLKTVQDNAQKIKDLFIDPDTALKFAKAGISLNTPQSEWGKKLSDQDYAEEVAKESKERANKDQSATPIAGVSPVQTIDSRGVVKNWYKAETDLGAKEKVDDTGKLIITTNDPTKTAMENNINTLSSIFASSKVSAGNKTIIGNGLALAKAAQDLADANIEGTFTGFSPLRRLTDIHIPFTKIGLPFREAGKRSKTIENESLISALDLQTQFWASGAALSDSQTALVRKMIPVVTDTDRQIKVKVNQVINYMLSQTASRLVTDGIEFKPAKVDMFETVDLLGKASPEQLKQLQEDGLTQ